MKLMHIAAATGLALATIASPAVAQHHSTTTVTRVHGPLKILPHHKRKYCRITRSHGHRNKKCWYH
jgi:hypothetical protein